jgi:hypothetical protein
MATSYRRLTMMIGVASLLAVSVAVLPPIAQDPHYHAFADGRTLHGVPNFWNVISNIPFFLVALYGIRALRSRTAFVEPWERIAYAVLLTGTAAVGAGSTYYHLQPDNARLVWDRLPMTVVFMSLVAVTIGERISMKAGRRLLLPMILLGFGSVLYWRSSGDLRLYCMVQFGSILTVPLILALFPPRYSAAGRMWFVVVLYAFAKIAELLDHQIAAVVATGGHPWKHFAAAAAILLYVRAVACRRPLQAPVVAPGRLRSPVVPLLQGESQ